jgi:hypothetical protein
MEVRAPRIPGFCNSEPQDAGWTPEPLGALLQKEKSLAWNRTSVVQPADLVTTLTEFLRLRNFYKLCINSSYCCDCERCCLLGYDAEESGLSSPTFRRNVLPAFGGSKGKSNKQTRSFLRNVSVNFYPTTRRHISEGSIFQHFII